MKLAQALIQRADMQKRMVQLQARIAENARVQEGDKPAEDPNRLIFEFNAILTDFVKLVAQINRTNLSVKTSEDQTLTDAIAERDGLKMKSTMLRAAADSAIGKTARVTRTECVVPRKGLEPSPPCEDWHLKPARLPISPPGRADRNFTSG